AALNAAALGLGVALARERIVAPFLDSGQLARLPVPSMPARWSYYLIHPTHRRLGAEAQAFADWLLHESAAYRPYPVPALECGDADDRHPQGVPADPPVRGAVGLHRDPRQADHAARAAAGVVAHGPGGVGARAGPAG